MQKGRDQLWRMRIRGIALFFQKYVKRNNKCPKWHTTFAFAALIAYQIDQNEAYALSNKDHKYKAAHMIITIIIIKMIMIIIIIITTIIIIIMMIIKIIIKMMIIIIIVLIIIMIVIMI